MCEAYAQSHSRLPRTGAAIKMNNIDLSVESINKGRASYIRLSGQQTNLVRPLVAVENDGVRVRLLGIHLGVPDPVPEAAKAHEGKSKEPRSEKGKRTERSGDGA